MIPTYDLTCDPCKKRVNEIFKGMNEDYPCPDCGQPMKHFIGPALFQFSSKSSLPPSASSKFNMSMRNKNFKKRLDAYDKLNKLPPNGVDAKKRYFGMEDESSGPRRYRPEEMRDVRATKEAARKSKKIVTST